MRSSAAGEASRDAVQCAANVAMHYELPGGSSMMTGDACGGAVFPSVRLEPCRSQALQSLCVTGGAPCDCRPPSGVDPLHPTRSLPTPPTCTTRGPAS